MESQTQGCAQQFFDRAKGKGDVNTPKKGEDAPKEKGQDSCCESQADVSRAGNSEEFIVKIEPGDLMPVRKPLWGKICCNSP